MRKTFSRMDSIKKTNDHYKNGLFLLFLASFVVLFPFPTHAQGIKGRVVAIADGDTITVLDNENTQHKVRLAGIDAPEKGQPYSQKSKDNLSRLVFSQLVRVEGTKRDRYGRTVAKVLVGGKDAGLEQIHAGLAWHFKRYEREQSQTDRGSYAEAEDRARAGKRGLWQDSAPVAPWDFRHPNQTENEGSSTKIQISSQGEVRGNRNSGIYHTQECRDYDRIAPKNRIIFRTEEEARTTGFRKAKNCR